MNHWSNPELDQFVEDLFTAVKSKLPEGVRVEASRERFQHSTVAFIFLDMRSGKGHAVQQYTRHIDLRQWSSMRLSTLSLGEDLAVDAVRMLDATAQSS